MTTPYSTYYDDIEARAEKATKEPWGHNRHGYIYGEANSLVQGSGDADQGALIRLPDAEFIVHARTDIPALVARCRELEAALERIEKKSNDSTYGSIWSGVPASWYGGVARAVLGAAPGEKKP